MKIVITAFRNTVHPARLIIVFRNVCVPYRLKLNCRLHILQFFIVYCQYILIFFGAFEKFDMEAVDIHERNVGRENRISSLGFD